MAASAAAAATAASATSYLPVPRAYELHLETEHLTALRNALHTYGGTHNNNNGTDRMQEWRVALESQLDSAIAMRIRLLAEVHAIGRAAEVGLKHEVLTFEQCQLMELGIILRRVHESEPHCKYAHKLAASIDDEFAGKQRPPSRDTDPALFVYHKPSPSPHASARLRLASLRASEWPGQ